MASDTEHLIGLLQVYQPLYMSLVNILVHKAQFPPDDEFSTWHAGTACMGITEMSTLWIHA